MHRLMLFTLLTVVANSQKTSAAIAVAEALKAANHFPKTNKIRDTSDSLTKEEKALGALSSANIASAQPKGVTVKVYRSSTARNQGRLKMIKECPGCSTIMECGTVMIYEPVVRDREINQIMQKRTRAYRPTLSKLGYCPSL